MRGHSVPLLLVGIVASSSCGGSTEAEAPPYEVDLALTSVITGEPVTDPEGLVGDTVQVSAVVRRGGQVVPNSGLQVVSTSDPAVARVVSESADEVAYRGAGAARLLVTLEEPVVEGGLLTDSLDVTVSGYGIDVTLESLFTGLAVDPADGWESDSVRLTGRVIRGVADTLPIAGATWTSSDAGVVRVANAGLGTAVLEGAGTAYVKVEFAEPAVPVRRDSVLVDVATYAVEISGPGSTPTMGDTVQYGVTVTDTRSGTDLSSFDRTFMSSNTTVIRFLNDSTGRALARDVGTSTVSVQLDDPTLPNPAVTTSAALSPTTISSERFYGAFSTLTGDFGTAVRVLRSEVHLFTDSTEIRFPNGTSGFVDSVSVGQDTLWFTVGAGTNAGQLTLINLEDDQGGARDTVLSRSSFTGGGTVDDAFEPNDAFPLPDTAAVNISAMLPFDVLLSMNPARTAPSDTNFFWLANQSPVDLDIRAETQQDANIDFFVCRSSGVPYEPPQGFVAACVRPKSDNDQGPDPRVEERLGLSLTNDVWIFGFYCVDGCTLSDPVVTYKVSIKEQP